MEDEMLIQRIKQGDDDAFRELYHKYVHQVFRYVYLQIGDLPADGRVDPGHFHESRSRAWSGFAASPVFKRGCLRLSAIA